MSFEYSEDLLQFIWQYQLYTHQNLKTTEGTPVTILKQGMLNKNSGPDFESASVKIGETTHHGAVEIHKKTSEWSDHKHQNDVAYNNVILHVCYQDNKVVYRKDGTTMPTLELAEQIDHSALLKYNELMLKKPFVYCENHLEHISELDKALWVDRLIVERLEERCTRYSSYLETSRGNWNQAFFTAIFRAFGMPINSEAFEEIALKCTYDLVQKHHGSLFQLEALFFGIAGLLEDEPKDNYHQGLKAEWVFLKTKYGLSGITTLLKSGKMRPMNLPSVKLAQLAAFFHHVPLFITEVLSLPDTAKVKKMLDFKLSTYWDTHYSLGKESKPRSKKISDNFINHLFLNAIIPFVFFYETQKQDGTPDRSIGYLEALPSEKNKIISQWKSTHMTSKNALTSQALLHLYKTYCIQRRCLQCNFGKKILLK